MKTLLHLLFAHSSRLPQHYWFLALLISAFLAQIEVVNGQAFLKEDVIISMDQLDQNKDQLRQNTINIPLKMGGPGFDAISSFQLFLQYDPAKLSLAGYIPEAINNVAVNSEGNMLILNWSNPSNPVNFTSTTILLQLQFNRISEGDVSLIFLPGSRVGNNQGLLPVQFVNGIIFQTWQLTLTSQPTEGGTTAGSGEYFPGQSINLTALPSLGFYFQNWTQNGNILSTNPSFTFTMPASNVSIQANFTPQSYQVTTQSVPAEGGLTSGSGVYEFGQNVSLNANAHTGYSFLNWTIDGEIVSTNPSYSFTMPAEDLSIWANFEHLLYSLDLDVDPPASGSATGGGDYYFNDAVTVVANASEGFQFECWTQNATTVSTNPIYNFLMPTSALQLTARFAINTYTVQIQANNPDFGSVTGSGTFFHNDPVTVSALPNEDYAFVAWIENSQIVSFQPIYTFNIVSERNLTAVFQEMMACPQPVELSVNDLSETTAVISWVSPSDIQAWDVLWDLADFDTLQTGNLVSNWTQNFLLLDNLSPQTSYDFYVRAICDDDLQSVWSGPYRFSTHYVGSFECSSLPQFLLYPNPAKESLTLASPSTLTGWIHYELIDNRGVKIIKETKWFENNLKISLASLHQGIYFFTATINSQHFTGKISVVN